MTRACAACLLLSAVADGVASSTQAAEADAWAPAVRRFVEMQQRGTPDYEMMEPVLRGLVAQQSERVEKGLRRMGRLQSLGFMRRNGDEHVYELWFEHGRMIWGFTTSPGGKFARVRFGLREHD